MHNRYISEFVLVLVVFCMAAPLVAADVDKWESAIAAFETDDQKNVYPNNSIMFVGSSSIRLWETLAEDMAPYDIIQRGFGGATTVDVVYYTNRILGDHHLQSIVLFVANDIRGKEQDDLSPEQAVGYFEQFLDKVHAHAPGVPVLIIAVTPTEKRWSVWPKVSELNDRIAVLCDQTKNAVFIPTEDLFLSRDGRPRIELFRDDKLHLNEKGYALWTRRVRSYLEPLCSTH